MLEVSLSTRFSGLYDEILCTVSTGVRFTTLPDATPPSFQLPSSSSPLSLASSSGGSLSQPPTTITALFNPMMGHISGAYAAKVSRDLSLCSRFDFNIYSYESEWTMGAEWWIRSSHTEAPAEEPKDRAALPVTPRESAKSEHLDDVHGVVKARASTTNVSVRYHLTLLALIVYIGCITYVGRTVEKYAGQLRRCFGLFKPFETYKSHRT